MSKYLLRYKRDIAKKTKMIKVSVMRLSWKEFDYLLKLELDENDYTVSRCRDFIDKHFTNTNLNNRPITRKGNKIFKTGRG